MGEIITITNISLYPLNYVRMGCHVDWETCQGIMLSLYLLYHNIQYHYIQYLLYFQTDGRVREEGELVIFHWVSHKISH